MVIYLNYSNAPIQVLHNVDCVKYVFWFSFLCRNILFFNALKLIGFIFTLVTGSLAKTRYVRCYSSSSDEPSSCSTKGTKLNRAKTPIGNLSFVEDMSYLKSFWLQLGKLDELEEGKHPYQEKEPLKPWPNNTNPNTGEVGGPKGPEPTRYGDWERKGRVTDF